MSYNWLSPNNEYLGESWRSSYAASVYSEAGACALFRRRAATDRLQGSLHLTSPPGSTITSASRHTVLIAAI
jgi:hypothetical protein